MCACECASCSLGNNGGITLPCSVSDPSPRIGVRFFKKNWEAARRE